MRVHERIGAALLKPEPLSLRITAGIPLDRHQRIAFRPARPDWRDQRLVAVAAGDVAVASPPRNQ
jgi:hypothetical protein